MNHDAVRDGRHLMAQDDDPDAAWIGGDAFYAECLRLMKPRLVGIEAFARCVRPLLAHNVGMIGRGDVPDWDHHRDAYETQAVEHPNYCYPQERTGDSTV